LNCPLKNDSAATIAEIKNASHHTLMITGDNPLTACHVAGSLKMSNKPILVLSKNESLNESLNIDNVQWKWHTIDDEVQFPVDTDFKQLAKSYSFCLSGESLAFIQATPVLKKKLREVFINCSVFARVDPKQKEWIVTEFKQLGFVALMCGDGTNDVGALKHAHVGVALLPGTSEKMEPVKEKRRKKREVENSNDDAKDKFVTSGSTKNVSKAAKMRAVARGDVTDQKRSALDKQQAKLREMLEEMDKEQGQIVKLGDASIASPFTSRYCTPASICHVIKQGRCTLVTTLQMFKILALNALILAYSQSVLYLDGIKFSDSQATLQGILLAGCFLFISRSKPLTTLSRERPLPNIFNLYTISTVLMQFAIHFCSLVYVVQEAYLLTPKEKEVDLEKKFQPSLVNSVVYIISMSMQVATFAVNYRGRPFMESLFENKPLFYSISISIVSLLGLLLGLMPEISDKFEIVPFPPEFQSRFCQVVVADFISAWLIDRILRFLFGRAKLRT